MKRKKIRNILHHVDDQTAAYIAENYPVADAEQKKRIYGKILSRRAAGLSGEEAAVSETHTAIVDNTPAWRHYAGMAAAIVLTVGITAGGIGCLLHTGQALQPASPVQLPTETGEAPAAETAALTAELETEPEPEPLTKGVLFNRSIYAIQNLTRLSGHVETQFGQNDSYSVGDMALDFTQGQYWYSGQDFLSDTGELLSESSSFTGNGRYVEYRTNYCAGLDDDGKPYFDGIVRKLADFGIATFPDNSVPIEQTPTHIIEFNLCYQPDGLCRGLLSDQSAWEIMATELYQGRECAVIEGTTTTYGARWNTTNFQVIIDIETGVWMLYEGYDDDGALQSFLHTELDFGDAASPVPLTSDAEIAEALADGFVLDEYAQAAYEQYLQDPGASTDQPMYDYTGYTEPAEMPAPFPLTSSAYPTGFYAPDWDVLPGESYGFGQFPPEVQALVTPEQWADWEALAEERKFPETASTSLMHYSCLYTFIKKFDIPADAVREALEPYMHPETGKLLFSPEELEMILSGNEAAMLHLYAGDAMITVGEKLYTPFWLYTHTVADYKQAKLPADQLLFMMPAYQRLGLTDEAWEAFHAKLCCYIEQEKTQ